MSHDRSDFTEVLRNVAGRAVAAELNQAGHPTLDELVAYHHGELPGAEAERVRDHLALCRECADLLLDYRDFDREEPAGAASATAAAWERHREAVREGVLRRAGVANPADDAGSGPPDRARCTPPAPPSPWVRSIPWAAAACLAALSVVLGLLWWNARTELQRPRPAVFASLEPEGSPALRGPEAPAEREVVARPGTRTVVLLGLSDPGAHSRYAARIVPPAGEGAARVVELEPGPDGVLALELGADPEPGLYRVVLSGSAEGERRELATYRFRLREP